MTYGFKFLNDSNETVIDDTNVKPWFYDQAPPMYTTDITNYSSFYQFNELNKTDGNGNPVTNWTPESGITSWKVYEIGYEVPVSYDCFILLNLPITSSKIFYSCEKPLSRIGNNRIIIYAYVPNTAIATVADIPKAYIFVVNPIPNALISTGYGIHIRNASAQYVFDSGKRHFQPKAFSQIYIKGLYSQYITNPGSYTTIETGTTGFSTLGNTIIPANAAWLLPSSDIIFGKWDDNEQAYKATHNVAVHKRVYIPGGINGLNVAQPKTFTSSSPTFSNTVGLFNNAYLIAEGQQQGFTDGSGVMLAIVADATPLDQGYTAPEFPQSFSLFRNVSNIIEGSSSGITITLTTTAVPNGTVVPYTITGISASDISSNTLSGNFVVNNNTTNTFLTATNDGLSEGTETATLALNNGRASISFTISDSVSYSLSSFTTPEEGQSIAVTLTTTNLPNGSTVPYTITGITEADLSVGTITGNFTISSNTGGLEFRFARDSAFEYETMRISVNSGATFLDIPITDVPAGNEILTISPSTFTYNQHTSITITGGTANTSFEFTNLPQGVDPVYAWNNRWKPEYSTVGTAYFDENGNFYNPPYTALGPTGSDLGGDPNSTVNRTFWIFTTYTKNFRSFNYTIGPEPAFFVSGTDNTQGPLYVNEGTTGFFKVTTANIPNGTVVYPKLIGGTLSANDFTNTGAGGITIQNNVATFEITFTADSTTDDGTEYAELVVQYPNGTTRNSYGNIFVSDTSLTPAGYSLTRTVPSGASVNEGNGAYYYLTTNQPNNLYWTLDGTNITTNDIVVAGAYDSDGNYYSYGADLSGIINQTYYQLFVYVKADVQTEGSETLTVNIRTGSASGPIVASSSVVINDTSVAPTYNESVTIVSDANGNYIVPLNGYMTISITGGAPNTDFTFAITNNGDPQPSSFPGVSSLDGSGSFSSYITGATFQGSQTVGDKRLWVKFDFNNNIRSARANIVYDAGTTSGGQYCSGFTLYQNYNDGAGGVYSQVVEYNNVGTCNYVQQYTPVRTASFYTYYNYDFQGDTWGMNGGRPGGAVTATIVTGPYTGFALTGTFNGSGQYRQSIGDYGALVVGMYTINFTFPGQDAYYPSNYRTIVSNFSVTNSSAGGGGIIP